MIEGEEEMGEETGGLGEEDQYQVQAKTALPAQGEGTPGQLLHCSLPSGHAIPGGA